MPQAGCGSGTRQPSRSRPTTTDPIALPLLRPRVLLIGVTGPGTRREIVGYFEMRHLYEDSRIYTCINALPLRLATTLRNGHAREEAQQCAG